MKLTHTYCITSRCNLVIFVSIGLTWNPLWWKWCYFFKIWQWMWLANRLKLDNHKLISAKCNDENYQHLIRRGFKQVWRSMNMISIQNIVKFRQTGNWAGLWKYKVTWILMNLLLMRWWPKIGSFCTEIEYDVIRQLFLTNSFFPTTFHMIGDNN